MKFSEMVLAEVVEILRVGLSEGKDISDLMRNIDVEVVQSPMTGSGLDVVDLSDEYLKSKGRN